jgi:hypothetical protein
MRKSCLTIVGLLALLTTARGLAQTAQQSSTWQPPAIGQAPQAPVFDQAPQALPADQAPRVPAIDQAPQALPADQSPQAPPARDGITAVKETVVTDGPVIQGEAAKACPVATEPEFVGYRYSAGSLEWIPGGGNQFGMFSIAWNHYQKEGITSGLGMGAGFHFLSGPDQTDMPPRTYDFSLAYQIRQRLGPLTFDASAAVLAASDFKGSAREGILFPSHAVGYVNVSPALDAVLGVDFLDRGDIKLLPVAGLIWAPRPDVRFEAVFPRPRAVFQLADRYRLYLAGELGGGTWEIERAAGGDDLATYRDLRVCIGLEHAEKHGIRSAFEIGCLFDRRLVYSSGIGDMNLDDAVMFRLVTWY